ncbi:hypothetical protein ACFLYV_05375, partial [Chloroflexota bacterium]
QSPPITYHLQVATDRNFAQVAQNKEAINVSEYTLTGDEALPATGGDATYFWRVRATDAAFNNSEWAPTQSYMVLAPQTPMLTLPEADAKASSQAEFDWEDAPVTGKNLTYTLQISPDNTFQVLLLEKASLTKSAYTLSAEERLATTGSDKPYYWRVKVVDTENNESLWSEARAFPVGFSFTPPTWLIITIIGLSIAIIGLFAFWFGRRTAFYQNEY